MPSKCNPGGYSDGGKVTISVLPRMELQREFASTEWGPVRED